MLLPADKGLSRIVPIRITDPAMVLYSFFAPLSANLFSALVKNDKSYWGILIFDVHYRGNTLL